MHVYSVTKFNTLVKAQNNNENFKIQVQFFSKHILFYKLSNFAIFPLVCDYKQIKIQFVVWLQSYLHTGHLWNDGFVCRIHLQITVNNVTWMEVLKCWYNLSTIETCPVFCEDSFTWEVEEELKKTEQRESSTYLVLHKICLRVNG